MSLRKKNEGWGRAEKLLVFVTISYGVWFGGLWKNVTLNFKKLTEKEKKCILKLGCNFCVLSIVPQSPFCLIIKELYYKSSVCCWHGKWNTCHKKSYIISQQPFVFKVKAMGTLSLGLQTMGMYSTRALTAHSGAASARPCGFDMGTYASTDPLIF